MQERNYPNSKEINRVLAHNSLMNKLDSLERVLIMGHKRLDKPTVNFFGQLLLEIGDEIRGYEEHEILDYGLVSEKFHKVANLFTELGKETLERSK